MKKLILSFLSLFLLLTVAGQPPQLMNYQAVVRNANGTPVSNGTLVSIRFTIHDSISSGTPLFSETQIDTANQFGLINTKIGRSGGMGVINWGIGEKFLQVEIDPSGGSNFVSMGTSQLVSVPYALYAASSPHISSSGVNLLGKLIGFNLNTTADQAVSLLGGTVYVLYDVILTNASTAPTSALDFEIWTGANRTGYEIANTNISPNVLTNLITPNTYINNQNNCMYLRSNLVTTNTVQLSLGTAQGTPATADVYIYGYILR